jgi:hemolysin activation/secretion protein
MNNHAPRFLSLTLPVRCRRWSALFLLALFAPLAPAASEAEPSFDILEYDVVGNTRLSDLAIERAVTPFLGEGKTLQDVDAARAALERAYHDAGYLTVVVSIPDQKVDDGNVLLNVVEATVDRLRVKGAEYHLAGDIKKGMRELTPGNVPYFPAVQRELDTLNRSADLKATPVLKAGRLPGTVEVILEVDDQLPVHGNVELNNRQSPGTEPLRVLGSIRYDNLWQAGHSLGLTAQTAPQATEQASVLSANYVMPVNAAGDALALYAVRSSSNVPGPTSILNNSTIVGLRLAIPLPSADTYGHSASFGLDYKHIDKVEGLVGGSASTVLQPSIRYVPLVASYNGNWQERGTTGIDATATLGLRGFLGNDDEHFNAKRPGASAQFFTLRTGLRQTETYARWTLSGRIEAQLASGLLIPNEQYAAGGVENVRGYQESEQSGDRAIRMSLELRTPVVQLGSAALPLRLTGVGFFDAARLTALQYDPIHAASLPPLHYKLQGVGVGLRLSGPRGLSLDVDVATALTDGGNANINTKTGDIRLHSRLVWEFL